MWHGTAADWPITRAELEPYYRRAQDICELGPYEYDPAAWVRGLHELIAAEPRVTATAVQTVGAKGYDGYTLIRVNS